MPAGEGETLGEALGALIGRYSRSGGVRSSYTAVGWHRQLTELTNTRAGREALGDNVSVTSRTLLAWLGDDRTPIRSNREAIQAAYDRVRGGGIPDALKGATIAISGAVKTGPDERVRGDGHHAPFLVDGSFGSWDRIEELWNDPDHDPADLEDAFIEDVVTADPAIGEGSDLWEFPGGGYVVTA